MTDSKKTALVVVANGSEEMEAVISIDVLRRAEVEVTVAGVDAADKIKCSRGVNLVPDTDLETAMKSAPFDVVVLPGGNQGAQTLAEVGFVYSNEYMHHSGLIGAICAAPIALKSHNIKLGSTVTSHPAVRTKLEGYSYSEARVVKDDAIITSRGPGTTFDFALAIVEALRGKETRDKVAAPMMLAQ